MAHSQRQKKRSSQFKKKHFEAKGRAQSEGGGKKEEQSESSALQNKEPQQGGVRREEKRDGSPVAVEKNADRHVQGDSRSEDSRKYSRRKLASNWDRYDCSDEEVATFSPETEEQLQQRLVQLLDLPLAPQATHWGTEEGTEVEGERGFLSLNVAELAESLSDLPVHVRLDLSPQLLEQYGVNETDLEVGGALVEQTPPPRDLVPGGQDVKSLLSRAKDIAKQSFDFRTPEKTIVGRQQPSSLGTQQTCADLLCDAGLDSLLLSSSRQRPHPLPPGLDSLPPCFSTDSLSPSAGVKSHPRDDCSPPSPISSSSSPARLPPSLVPAVEPSLMPTNDELDDILDDLLS